MIRPHEGLCPVCGETFLHSRRPQGGGRLQIYCTSRCRSLDWVRGNGASRQATVTKYDSVPDSAEKKARGNRRRLLAKYGWTEQQFLAQLKRQNYSCAGCLAPITEQTARIDHDHTTGKVRGLLDDACNWALGHAKDSASTLRRLMVHMDRDLDKTFVYLIGALKNQRIPLVGNILRSEGYDVMDEWFTPGPEADSFLQEYAHTRGWSYAEALNGRAAQNIFLFDRSYIDTSDVAVLVMPAGKSAMLELGYAKGRGKKTVIFLDGDDPERYDIMSKFADVICKTEEELIHVLREYAMALR